MTAKTATKQSESISLQNVKKVYARIVALSNEITMTRECVVTSIVENKVVVDRTKTLRLASYVDVAKNIYLYDYSVDNAKTYPLIAEITLNRTTNQWDCIVYQGKKSESFSKVRADNKKSATKSKTRIDDTNYRADVQELIEYVLKRLQITDKSSRTAKNDSEKIALQNKVQELEKMLAEMKKQVQA